MRDWPGGSAPTGGRPQGATLRRLAGVLVRIGHIFRACRRAVHWAVVAAITGAVLWTGVISPAVPVRASEPERTFWVVDNGVYKRIACDQVAVGTRATVFNCGQSQLAPREAEVLIHAFDKRIFPTDIQDFGAPRGLHAVTIVMAPFSGTTFGYFNESDLAPAPGVAAHSNHGNFLYVRSLVSMPDPNRMADVQEALAHELQHLIDFRIRVLDRGVAPQQVWLNEGLSFYAQLANGFWTPRDQLRLEAAASDPGWPLTSMTESAEFLRQFGPVSYGRAGMFVAYLAGQYGPRFTRDLVRNRQSGMRGIDAVLRREKRGTCVDAFAHWSVAQVLNDAGLYGYRGILRNHFVSPRSTYPTVTSFPFETPATGHDAVVLQPWTQGYMRFSAPPGLPVTIQMSAPSSVRLAAVFSTPGAPLGNTVRWLKHDQNHGVTVHIGSYAPGRGSVTIAMSAIGNLQTGLTGGRAATIQFRAASIYPRHDKGMSRTTPSTRPNANIVI